MSIEIVREQELKFGIYDTFHPRINGDSAPLVSSNMFINDIEFFNWCKQHGADNKWFTI